MYQKIAVVLVSILVVKCGVSQERVENKLGKLYEKGKLEKCFRKAESFQAKYPRNGSVYFYLAKLELHRARNSRSVTTYGALKKSIRTYSLSVKYDRPDPEFYDYELRPKLLEYCEKKLIQGDSSKALGLARYMAKYMNDSLAFYMAYLERIHTPTITQKRYASSPKDKEDSLRRELLKAAEELVGSPYVYGGESPNGFDCSGFTKYVYGKIGVELPHNAHMQSQLGQHKTLEDAEEGDLVFFGYKQGAGYRAIHAGIIYENDSDIDSAVVHCVSKGVAIEGKDSSWDRYWKNKVLFVANVFEK